MHTDLFDPEPLVDLRSFPAADAVVPDRRPRSGTVAAIELRTARRWSAAGVEPLDPVAVVFAWRSALLVRRDWATLWSVTDPNLRLASAQAWLAGLGREGDNTTAWSLAAELPHLGLWAAVADQVFAGWADELARSSDVGLGREVEPGRGPRRRTIETGSSRPDPGLELCVVNAPGLEVTLRRRDRWRVAGLGAAIVRPGWPSCRVELANEANHGR